MNNLGNIVALIRSTTPPDKKYIIWGEIIDPQQPNRVIHKVWDDGLQNWVPLREPKFWIDPVKSIVQNLPSGALAGERYLVSPSPDSSLAAYANNIVIKTDSSWIYKPMPEGASVQVLSANNSYTMTSMGVVANAGAGAGGMNADVYFNQLLGDPENNDNIVAALQAYRDEALATLRDGVITERDTLQKISLEISRLAGVNLKIPEEFDANTETVFPTGSTEAGDTYFVTVAGTVDGVSLGVGDLIWTAINDATPNAADWNVLPRLSDNATESLTGVVRIATEQEMEEGTVSAVVTAVKLKYWYNTVIGTPNQFQAFLDGDSGPRDTLLKELGGRVFDKNLNQSSAASIFVTDVFTVDPGSIILPTEDLSAVGETIITGISTNDNAITLTLFISGGAQWSPEFTANGETVSLTRIPNTHSFTGTVEVPLPDGTDVITILGNGGRKDIDVNFIDDAPVIQSISFGSLPGTQTELKNGDQITVTFELENTADLSDIVVEDYGAFNPQVAPVTIIDGTQASVVLTVGHSHSEPVASDLGLRARTRTTNGSESNSFTSTATVSCNNYGGTLTVDSIDYPASQTALKDSESVTLNLSYTDVDSIDIQATEVTVIDPQVLSTTKTATLNATGQGTGYRNTGNNVTIDYTRDANGKTTTVNSLVKIAHVDTDLADNTLVTLRANGSVTINLNQVPDSIAFNSVPVGTFNSLNNVDADTWQLLLDIADGDARSDTTLQLQVDVVNQAGKLVTLNRDYKVKGFTAKTITFVHNSFQEVIPVAVTDAANLIVSGEIQSTPVFELNNMQQDAALNDATDYDLSGNDLVLSNETESFGYQAGQNVVITIEETA